MSKNKIFQSIRHCLYLTFVFRDGRIEEGDELLVIDDRAVAGGGLSSQDVNDILTLKLQNSSIPPDAIGFTKDLRKQNQKSVQVLDNGSGIGVESGRHLDLVVARYSINRSSSSTDYNRRYSGDTNTTSAFTPRRPTVVSFGDNNMVVSHLPFNCDKEHVLFL